MLTIFANIRINENEEEGLQHLKDSFYSFNTISDNWLINVRGTLRAETIDFLAKELTNKAVFFELFDDSRGWIKNALEYVFKRPKNNFLFYLKYAFYLLRYNPYLLLNKILKKLGLRRT